MERGGIGAGSWIAEGPQRSAVSGRAGRHFVQAKRFSNREKTSARGAAAKPRRLLFPRISRHHLFPGRQPRSGAQILESRGKATAKGRGFLSSAAVEGIAAESRPGF